MRKILIVDDDEINRTILEAGLCDLFDVIQTDSGKDALDYLYFDDKIDAVLLDLNMPKVSGFDVLKDLNESGLLQKIPVFIVTAASDDEKLLQAYELGAVDVVFKPYNIKFLRNRVSNTIELYSQRNNLSKIVEEKTKELVRQNNRLVEAMADIVEFRSRESGTHVKRVSGYTRIIMEGLVDNYPEYSELRNDIDNISFASCLHDIGKIAISDTILNKPARLEETEFEMMKTHTIHGYEQILALKDIMSPELYKYSLDIVRYHHERYDGRGYPDKLVGDAIPIWAQAVGLADVYDALTTERCYKKAFDHETSCKMILEGDCGVFNPKLMAVFEKLMKRCDELRQGILRKKILIVDDSEIDRATLRTILNKEYDVDEIESGPLALMHLTKKPGDYAAVIVDMMMPAMDGFEMISKLDKTFISDTPVIMCSGAVDKDVIKKANDSGVRTFIKKPFDHNSLMDKIHSITEL